jgi:hypothetical protein
MRDEDNIYEHWKFELNVTEVVLNSEICSFEGHADWSRMIYTIHGDVRGYTKTMIDPISLTELTNEWVVAEKHVVVRVAEEPKPSLDKVNVFFPGKNHQQGDPFVQGRCAVLGELITPNKGDWRVDAELDPKVFSKVEKAGDLFLANSRSILNLKFTVGVHEVSRKRKGANVMDQLIVRDVIYMETRNNREERGKIFGF